MKKLKVLIVEDDYASKVLLNAFAQSFASEVIFTVNGLDAVDIFKNHQDIDLILMDIRMPVMDGTEATKQIRKLSSQVVVIAQSAYTLNENIQEAMDAGCNDFISKPVTRNALNKAVEKHFALSL